MERIIGKYTISVANGEIDKDNFFKHSVSILKPEFIYIDKSEDALKGYVRNLKDRIEEALKQ